MATQLNEITSIDLSCEAGLDPEREAGAMFAGK